MNFRLLKALILIGFLSVISAQSQSLEEVRKVFHKAVMDPAESHSFYQFLEKTELNTATLKAYKAVSEVMMARVVWNPFTKLSKVMKYNDLMEMAVKEDEDNIEIRFLRIATEYNLPRFLGMSKHLDEDRKAIMSNIKTIRSMNLDPSFGRYIFYFLNQTGLYTPAEIAEMEERLENGS